MFSFRKMKSWWRAGILAGMGALVLGGANQTVFAQSGVSHSHSEMQEQEAMKTHQEMLAKQKAVYLLDKCPVTGQKLTAMGGPIDYTHDGQALKLCCKGCIEKFEAEPQQYLKKIDEMIAEKELARYPLENCPVTGGKLGMMGEPVNHQHQGRLVRFCCQGCVEKFASDSAKYGKEMDEAIVKKQLPLYPLQNCLVSGDKLGGEMGQPIDLVQDNQLVRLCCKGCVSKFNKDPGKYMALLDKAQKAKKGGADK